MTWNGARVRGTGSSIALRLPNLLGTNPFITGRMAEAQLAVASNTAAVALQRLVRLRIVKQAGDARRDLIYCAQVLLEILEQPSRLHPV
jgi:hypothetical protein